MQVSKEQLIELLKRDLELEYTAALQYIQHYSVMQGAQYDNIRQHLLTHSEEEIGHAVKISDRINYMGGTPGAAADAVKVAPEAMQMLAQDLEGEQTAISRYKERISQAQAIGEYGLVEVLQSILVDEEEHENDLKTSMAVATSPVAAPVASTQAVDSPLVNPAYVPDVMAKLASLMAKRRAGEVV